VKSRLQNTPVVFDCPVADDRSGPLKRRAHRPHRGGKALYVRVRRRVDAEGFEIGPWRLDARDLRIGKAVGENRLRGTRSTPQDPEFSWAA
jgi:hypothetical protein